MEIVSGIFGFCWQTHCWARTDVGRWKR